MKIYNWIDSYFDTKEKRLKWVLWISALYLLWQLIWLDVFFYQLIRVNSYESLFTFMNSMKVYSQSVLIRIVFGLISGNHIDLVGLIVAIFNNVYVLDYIMIGICALAALSRKKGLRIYILSSMYFIFLCTILILGFASSSVFVLLSLLKVLSLVSFVLFVSCTVYLVYRIVCSIVNLYEKEYNI
ncbi:MAG: hypothetical protein Q4C49_05770 [Bacillota bacterium]|nr:hypothetical protein [Bacillota bacterium]